MSAAPRRLDHPARRLHLGAHGGIWVVRLLLILFCLLVLLPAFWVFSASIQPGSSAYSSSLWPAKVSWDNYRQIIEGVGITNGVGFFTWLRNSLIVSLSAGILSLSINVLGAYAFSRLRFFGSRFGLLGLFLLQVFPQTMAIAAIYTLVIKANLYDTLPGLILIFMGGSAFNMWLMKNYMDSIPRELDESAHVDGAGTFATFILVILPLMRPILATIFVWSFAGAYNDFIFGNLILQSPDNYTIPVGLQHLVQGQFATNWALFSAGAVLGSLPILIIFMSLQRLLVSGLAAGSVKG